jgi:membrane-associated protease RseP (regulator of RpoE activity)
MKAFLLILLAISLSLLVHVLFTALTGWLMGAKVEKITIFSGPKLFRTKIKGIEVAMYCIPTGSSVGFKHLDKLKTPARIIVAASGSLILLLLASNLLGLNRGYQSFLSGFTQFFAGVMPLSRGQYLLGRLAETANNEPVPTLLAVIAVKIAAFNLLPLPALNGGHILNDLLRLIIDLPDKLWERLNIFGFLAILAVGLGWLVAIIYYWVH